MLRVDPRLLDHDGVVHVVRRGEVVRARHDALRVDDLDLGRLDAALDAGRDARAGPDEQDVAGDDRFGLDLKRIRYLPPCEANDEIFFVDLPQRETRRDIFAIHLKKRRRDPAGRGLPPPPRRSPRRD